MLHIYILMFVSEILVLILVIESPVLIESQILTFQIDTLRQ